MSTRPIAKVTLVMGALAMMMACSTPERSQLGPPAAGPMEAAQVPTWSRDDLGFFLHGSMSTEVVPEPVLRAFMVIYPDLYPTSDFSHFGLIPDPAFGWPVGISRDSVAHLGGLPALGINCAACHVGDVAVDPSSRARVLGMTSLFDAEGFFGALISATFQTGAPDRMQQFLAAYLQVQDPESGERDQRLFQEAWAKQQTKITETLTAATAYQDIAPGALYELSPADLRLDARLLEQGADLSALARSMVRLFHNMRAALHVPDQPPSATPPASGPGRNDAFGLLSLVLFGEPQPYAPVKYGLVWNVQDRRWVHWDGNTQSPIGRNLLAALGLGAPLNGKRGQLDFALVKRQTDLTEQILAPRYPWLIDQAKAARGSAHYRAHCASCHDGRENDSRLHAVAEVGTEPTRALAFTAKQAELFNRFLAELETPGYQPGPEPGIRSTTKYWAPSLSGVWARSPYLHNGSVRTMQQLLSPPTARATTFRRGTPRYDPADMGYADEGPYVLNTGQSGNSNSGHNYGTGLADTEKAELIEYLKTL